MVIHKSFCPQIVLMRRSMYTRDSVSTPGAEFFPINTQPSVSASVFPECMRIPVKPGTRRISGVYRLNLFDMDMITRYVPAGIAVLPGIFSPALTVSSKVSEKNTSSTYKCPIVYFGLKYSLSSLNITYSLPS